jgi:Protein of unknown function (DUF2637)
MTGRADRWIRSTTTGCVALLALIAGTVSYLHMHLLVELHGQPGWVAALTPLSVDGMIVAASTTLLADSRAGERGGGPAVGAAGSGQRGEPSRQRRCSRADGDGAGDRRVAVVRADRRLRAADAPSPPKRRGQRQGPARKAQAADLRSGGSRQGRPASVAPVFWAGCARRGVWRSGWCGPGLAATGVAMGAGPPRRMARCRAGARSPASTAGTSGGAAWSSAQEPPASSLQVVNPANRAYAWSVSTRRRIRTDNLQCSQREHVTGRGLGAALTCLRDQPVGHRVSG